MDITIRFTIQDDLPALLDIYNYEVENGLSTFDLNPKTMDEWKKWYDNHKTSRHFALTALSGGIPVGYASLSGYREKEAYAGTAELSVYVRRDLRRRGIAEALVSHAITTARRRGDVHTIVSVITGGNAASSLLHEKLGFTCCGTIRQAGKKFGKYLDIVNWQLIL